MENKKSSLTGVRDDNMPAAWEALKHWGKSVSRVERLTGGVANDVWSVRINGQLAVGRLGTRSDEDLAQETELIQYLARHGLHVPVPIPTSDGRLFADHLVVMQYIEGRSPKTQSDWNRVAHTLCQLHRLTKGWPQRPGWRASTDLWCKAQMRIIAFIQDALSIKDIKTAQGIPDFQAPPPIPKFIDTSHAIDELPQYDAFEPSPDDLDPEIQAFASKRSRMIIEAYEAISAGESQGLKRTDSDSLRVGFAQRLGFDKLPSFQFSGEEMTDSMYEEFRELLTGDALSAEQKEERNRPFYGVLAPET